MVPDRDTGRRPRGGERWKPGFVSLEDSMLNRLRDLYDELSVNGRATLAVTFVTALVAGCVLGSP